MKRIATRCDLKRFARVNGWALLSEDKGAIAFLLSTGKVLAAQYDPDSDKLILVNDTANTASPLPFTFDEEV